MSICHLEANPYSIVEKLSGIQQVDCTPLLVLEYLVVQPAQVICHRIKQDLGKDIALAPAKETPEPVILLQYTKCPFRLYRTVHSERLSPVRGNAIIGLFS